MKNIFSLKQILKTKIRFLLTSYAIIIFSFFSSSPIQAGEFLSDNEVIKISGATVGTFYLGYYLRRMDTTRTPLINGPILLDRTIQRLLNSTHKQGKLNFLDSNIGSAFTPITGGVLLFISNLSYSNGDKNKVVFQDLFLYSSGLITTKGITDLSKGIVARPRPYRTLVPAHQREENGFTTDRSSFFSGHTSAAFFSATYLNLRVRFIMRNEMSSDDYHNWRWAPPTFLFSWASFVGLSRVHAYKHYFSDVLVGALAGYLIAELFYSFGNKTFNTNTGYSSPKMIFRLRITL